MRSFLMPGPGPAGPVLYPKVLWHPLPRPVEPDSPGKVLHPSSGAAIPSCDTLTCRCQQNKAAGASSTHLFLPGLAYPALPVQDFPRARVCD